MAKLVDDQIVLELGRKVHDAIVEIEITFFGAAPPPGSLIFDAHFADRKAVDGVKALDAFNDDSQSTCFVFGKALLASY